MLYLSVDSIRDGFAVCENDYGEKVEVELQKLPLNTKEGDVILVKDSGETAFDEEEKKRRQREAISLLEKILKSNK